MKITHQKEYKVMDVDDEEEGGGWRLVVGVGEKKWWPEIGGLSPESWWPDAPEEVVEVKRSGG